PGRPGLLFLFPSLLFAVYTLPLFHSGTANTSERSSDSMCGRVSICVCVCVCLCLCESERVCASQVCMDASHVRFGYVVGVCFVLGCVRERIYRLCVCMRENICTDCLCVCVCVCR